MDEKSLERLKGIDVWIVDCLRRNESLAHSHIERTLEWIQFVKPRRAYLTHMTNELDYGELLEELPTGVKPAYDGLVIEI